MAKFKDLHLLIQEEQRILFGDDALGPYGPAVYPAVDPGNEKPFMAYTTISGYNTTLPGSGTTVIPEVDELVISTPVAGERATEDYHLVRYDQLDDFTPDHGDLTGLEGDDHPQYILVDGTRGFTGTVSGIDPTESYHLTTRWYVDGEITTISGIIYDELNNYFHLTEDNTISGTNTFEGPTIFNNDVTYSGTISGTGDIYTTNIYAENQKWGRMAVVNGNRDQAVVFDNAWPDDDYTVVATLTNEVEAKPSIYSTIQGVKTAGGFTTHFSGKIDSANFILEWHAFYGQKH